MLASSLTPGRPAVRLGLFLLLAATTLQANAGDTDQLPLQGLTELAQATVTIPIDQGFIVGNQQKGYNEFLGIPYAAPA
jgi:carboxylesterase type B